MYYTVRRQFNYYLLDPHKLEVDLIELIQLAQPSPLFVVFDDVSENSKYSEERDYELFTYIKSVVDKHKVDYCFITNVANRDFNFPIKNVAFSSFGLVTYYHQYFGKNKDSINSVWNHESKKALYMPGKIQRLNRTLPMYELYRNNLIENLVWSYNVNDKSKTIIREQFLNHLTDSEFENFVATCNKSLDINVDNDRVGFDNDFVVFNPWPYDPKPYSDTSFSIISETWFNYGRDVSITEKTYRPILNLHPFILIGAKGTLEELNRLGFNTFTEYLTIKDYDQIDSEYERIIAAIKNVEFFQRTFTNHIEEIKLKLMHNFNNFHSMMEKEIKDVSMVIPTNTDPRTPFSWQDVRHCP